MNVEILDVFGNDLMVVNVARVSYGKESSYEELDYDQRGKCTKIGLGEKDIKLISYLVNHGHTSPFRHPQLQMRIKCPLYCERQLFKHQVGWSANSISGRYVDFSDTYYKIKKFRKQSTSSKQGSAEDLLEEDNIQPLLIQDKVINYCTKAYKDLLNLGVSKEQARSVLPLSLETEFIWTGSLLAFIHLCKLRLKPDAQKETRDLVQKMLNSLKEEKVFEHSLNAFGFS